MATHIQVKTSSLIYNDERSFMQIKWTTGQLSVA